MLTLQCPYCGVQCDETELTAGGEAHLTRHGPGSDADTFEQYLFLRENPRGVHFERWRHAHGCGKWFHAARSTTTLRVFGTYKAQTTEPPQQIRDAISAVHPGWSWRNFGETA
ncbi:sarcosine oxidase subunit delta [Palleronia pelagia]|uniref:Sarcosine oxidase subunit delta n=1 Tax=Palleronia pelagia TaxID=387096 RepID=A0A1H8I469_9RHOB|nr:sarcosine oxidase subunit delta [Palleronia pelagia]SEN62806.1 sarcosine oxidase subunit delta [Palleronia pelagia]